MVIRRLRKRLNPPCCQGTEKNVPHFEGWYFKVLDRSESHRWAVIPGLFRSENPQESHAFIQVFDGVRNRSVYLKFPLEAFQSREGVFDIQIDSNRFSSHTMQLDLNHPSLNIKGELTFSGVTRWPKTLINPGIMGWYTWVPFMECYHGIVSLDHQIEGALSIQGQRVDFSGGRGYTEKDWGRSFPEAWIWCQSNHFTTPHVSLTGSIAIIPWFSKPFPGFIFGLWHQDRLYRFTTYNGAKLRHLEIKGGCVHAVLERKRLRLELEATYGQSGSLQAPTLGGMTRQIFESMDGVVEIRLSAASGRGDEVLFSGIGRGAGFEMAGDLDRLLKMQDT